MPEFRQKEMVQTLEQTQQEILNIQQDRMRIINENEKRFKELEQSDDAQIKLNQLFNKQIIALEDIVNNLEIRLKKEEIRPMVAIPSASIAPSPKPTFLKRFLKK